MCVFVRVCMCLCMCVRVRACVCVCVFERVISRYLQHDNVIILGKSCVCLRL
jgi:hypothetical protein